MQIFDTESAKTDPRANGEDASVGLVDVPLICCVKLTEILLASSLALPPAGRSVGQFYVSFSVKQTNMSSITVLRFSLRTSAFFLNV